MSEPVAPEKPDFIEKIADYAGWILAASVAVIIAAWSLYFFQFRGSLSDDTAIWGQFGDFVGGTLNSVFAFFSFMILLSSLRLQLKELRLTREELEATREELAKSGTAQKKQADHFDREARKKDHLDAIGYILETTRLEENSLRLIPKNNSNKFFLGYHAYEEDFPTNTSIDNEHYTDFSLKKLANSIKNLQRLDYHCATLYEIYPDSPILSIVFDRFDIISVHLEKKGWAFDLKFFGKINPLLK